jgi:hypothetical protein
MNFFKSKKDIILKDINGHTWYLLKEGKVYKGDFTPTMYDPNTLMPVPKGVVICCEDGKMRKFEASDFYTLEDWRDQKLNEIGIKD